MTKKKPNPDLAQTHSLTRPRAYVLSAAPGDKAMECEHCKKPARVAVVAGLFVTVYLCITHAENLSESIEQATA